MARPPEPVEDLLYREAELLDRRRFTDWLALFDDEAWYWVPLSPDQTDPFEGLSHVFDDRGLLEVRVDRLSRPGVIPQDPESSTSRIVGNIRLVDATDGEYRVASRLHMVEYRGRPFDDDDYRVWAAAVQHRLVETGGALRIRSKRVDLVNATAALEMISIPF